MTKKFLTILIVSVLFIQLPLAGRTTSERLMPDSTTMAVVIRDGEELWKGFEGTALGEIYGEPGVKALVDALIDALTRNEADRFKFLLKADSALGMDIAPDSDAELRLLLVTTAPGAKQKLTTIVAKYTGQPGRSAQFDGSDATTFTVPQIGEVLLIQREHFVLLGEKNMLRSALQVLAKKRASLVDTPGYRAAAGTMTSGPGILFYINIPRLLELAKKSPQAAVFLQSRVATMLGLNAMQGFMVASWPAPPGVADKAVLTLKGPGRKLWATLFSGKAETKLFSLVPHDAHGAAVCELKLLETLNVLEQMLGENPENLQQYLGIMATVKMMTGVHPKDDLIAALNGRLVVYSYMPEKPVAAPKPRFTVLLGTSDQAKLATTLDAIAMAAGGDTETVGGKQAWTFNFPMAGPQAPPASLWIVPASPWTIIGTNKSDIEAAMKGAPAKSITDEADFQTIMKRLPADAWARGYSRFKEPYRVIHKTLPEFLSTLPGGSELPPLPPVEKIADHLFPGGYTSSLTATGLEVEYWSPTGIAAFAAPAAAAGFGASRKVLMAERAREGLKGTGPSATGAPAMKPIKIKQAPIKPTRPFTPKDRLVTLGLAAVIYQALNNGRLPRTVSDLREYVSRPDALGGPGEVIIPHGATAWPVRSLDQFIVLYKSKAEPDGNVLVLFADGKVRSLSPKALGEALSKSRALATR